MDWIQVAQNWDQSRVFLNTVMSLQVPQEEWNFANHLRDYQLLKKDYIP